MKRQPGLLRTDGGCGFPKGCAGLQRHAIPICTARQRGEPCLLCVRSGALPVPAIWPQGAANILGHPSVQVIRSGKDGCWYVVCFVGGVHVDPRYPVIACRTQAQAVDLAKKRGRQIAPTATLEERGPGDWRRGPLFIWVLGYGR